MIQMYSPDLGEEELEAVRRVFQSRWIGSGKECEAFESELGAFWRTENVLLLNNCTAGLFLAMKLLEIGSGHEVILSSINFVGCANAVLAAGATPVFADVDPVSFTILPDEIERLKTPRTKAVIVLHYGGHAAPFESIREAAGEGVFLIEDAANAPASDYNGRACGTLGDIGVFSFDAMKALSMGDGGAIIVRDPYLYHKAKALRYLGFKDKAVAGFSTFQQGGNRWWEFDVEAAAGRYISNDILASIGRVQLLRLPEFIQRRKSIWERYQRELLTIPEVILPPEPLEGTTSSYYMYWIRVEKRRDELAICLAERGIYTAFRYFPLHLVPFYECNQPLKTSELLRETGLNLPLHPNLTENDVERVIVSLRAFFG